MLQSLSPGSSTLGLRMVAGRAGLHASHRARPCEGEARCGVEPAAPELISGWPAADPAQRATVFGGLHCPLGPVMHGGRREASLPRRRVRQTMVEMAARGHAPNEWTWNCLLNAECSAGDLAAAERVLTEMRDAVRRPSCPPPPPPFPDPKFSEK